MVVVLHRAKKEVNFQAICYQLLRFPSPLSADARRMNSSGMKSFYFDAAYVFGLQVALASCLTSCKMIQLFVGYDQSPLVFTKYGSKNC